MVVYTPSARRLPRNGKSWTKRGPSTRERRCFKDGSRIPPFFNSGGEASLSLSQVCCRTHLARPPPAPGSAPPPVSTNCCTTRQYCAGRTPRLLGQLGFSKVEHSNQDFYQVVREKRQPKHDVLITNPPYSGDHKKRCLEYCRASGKPWFLLVPNYVATKDYYRLAVLGPAAGPGGEPFYMVGRGRGDRGETSLSRRDRWLISGYGHGAAAGCPSCWLLLSCRKPCTHSASPHPPAPPFLHERSQTPSTLSTIPRARGTQTRRLRRCGTCTAAATPRPSSKAPRRRGGGASRCCDPWTS